MKILLDTHVLIWTLQDSPMLPFNIREAIVDENNEIYVSVLSLWEIAIKHKKIPKYFFPCAVFTSLELLYNLNEITLAMDAIKVPNPPTFTPIKSCL